MSSFDWKKNVVDRIKDEVIITATSAALFFAIKAANVKPPKTSLDGMEVVGGIIEGTLVKNYAVCKKLVNE